MGTLLAVPVRSFGRDVTSADEQFAPFLARTALRSGEPVQDRYSLAVAVGTVHSLQGNLTPYRSVFDAVSAGPLLLDLVETTMHSDPEANRRLVGRYFEFVNEPDPSVAEEVLSPKVVFVGPRKPEGIRGREAFIEFIEALRQESPDLRFSEGETVVEGDRVASVFRMTRTYQTTEGEAKVIVTEGMDLFHIVAGRIQRIIAYFDRLGQLGEMGVVKLPPA